MLRFTRVSVVVALLAIAGAIAAASIYAAAGRVTHIGSPIGGTPSADGPSDNSVWSQDGRDPRLFAFDSAASNITSGDTNGARDVFVLKRTPGEGNLGGTLVRASVSSAGVGGNGPSLKPSLDGQGDKVRPHYVAFESSATHLDPTSTSATSRRTRRR
jgi:hypothetical protein